MIAADMIGLLDQQQARARSPLGKGKRDQPPGKAATDNRKIAFQISHPPLLATPTPKAKRDGQAGVSGMGGVRNGGFIFSIRKSRQT